MEQLAVRMWMGRISVCFVLLLCGVILVVLCDISAIVVDALMHAVSVALHTNQSSPVPEV